MISPTHHDLKDLKKQFKIKNSDIAEIVGLTVDSVKTMTQPNKELPSWAKAMIFVWKKQKNNTSNFQNFKANLYP